MNKQNWLFWNSSCLIFYYLLTYLSTVKYFELFFEKSFIINASLYSGISAIVSSLISRFIFIFSNKTNFLISLSFITILNFIIFIIPNIINNLLINKIIFNAHVCIKSFMICYFLGLNMNLALPLSFENSNYLNIGISVGSLLGSVISIILLTIFKNNLKVFVITFLLIQFIYLLFYIYLIYINFDDVFNNKKLNKKNNEKKYFQIFTKFLHLFIGNIISDIFSSSIFPNILMFIKYKGIKETITDQLSTVFYKTGNIIGKSINRKYSNIKPKYYHIMNFSGFLFFIFFMIYWNEKLEFNGYLIIGIIFLYGISYGYFLKVALVLIENSTKTIEEKKDAGFIYSFGIKGGMGIGLILIFSSSHMVN